MRTDSLGNPKSAPAARADSAAQPVPKGALKKWTVQETHSWKKSLVRNYDLYLLLIPVIAYFVVFSYGPMYGLQIAFKDYSPALGIEASPWAGLKHLARFFNSFYFERIIKNTLTLSVTALVVKIPAPLILALLFEEIRSRKLRVAAQTLSYAPYFISTVVLCSMIVMFLTPGTGFIDSILRFLGYANSTSILSSPNAFGPIYVVSAVWETIGWDSIIYTAAIAGVPQELYEVARLDGASRFKQIWYVTLPCIVPTIATLSIMAIGNVLNIGYEKVYLLQNTANLSASEVISTYVYKSGLQQSQYSFASMVGLFNNAINFIILIFANKLSKRLTETSLW